MLAGGSSTAERHVCLQTCVSNYLGIIEVAISKSYLFYSKCPGAAHALVILPSYFKALLPVPYNVSMDLGPLTHFSVTGVSRIIDGFLLVL